MQSWHLKLLAVLFALAAALFVAGPVSASTSSHHHHHSHHKHHHA